jgi:hypothetical protein
MPKRPFRSWAARVAAFLGVAAAAPALSLARGWLDAHATLGCPDAAHGWIAGAHFCRSFRTVFVQLAVAEILLAAAVFLLARWAGWRRCGPWLSLLPIAWLAVSMASLYREAADMVGPEAADKVEFFDRGDRPLAWVAGGILLLGVAVFLWRAVPRAGAGRPGR